jgi:hypothetical protein
MNLESLFSSWARLGINFPGFKPSSQEPLVEDLIAATTVIGRYEPRLLECMAGWLFKHSDLVNTSLMHKRIKNSEAAVLGIILEMLHSKESTKLRQLAKYCKPKSKAEMLFYTAETSATMKAEAVQKATSVNKRWNVYFASFRIKTDSVLDRRQVLKNNPNLARRAIFGNDLKTEILNFLITKGMSYPAEITKYLGYRYHQVFTNIQELIKDGLVIDTALKKRKKIHISPLFQNYLTALPY